MRLRSSCFGPRSISYSYVGQGGSYASLSIKYDVLMFRAKLGACVF